VTEDDLPAALLLIVLAAFACVLPAQADTFYHLRSGLEMWRSGQLLTRELFSWTEYGHPLPNHWWLSQLTFYGLYSLGGPLLLTIVAGGLAFVAVFLSWRLVTGAQELRLVLITAYAVTLLEWSVRPQVFSLVLTVVAIRLVLSDRLLLLPLLLVLWANLHAVVVLGIGIAWVPLLDAVAFDRGKVRRALPVALASLVAPLLTPLGIHFWSWLVDTVGVSRALGLQEYRSAFVADPTAIGFWMIVAALVIGLARKRTEIATADRETRLLVIAAVILVPPALTSLRNIPFFALAAIPAVSRLFATKRAARVRPAGGVAWVMVGAAAVVAVATIATRWIDGGRRLGWQPLSPAAVAAIRACPEKLYNGLYEGGLMIWFVPERRVFIDGRVDVYPLALSLRARQADLEGEYRDLFADYGIACAVVRRSSPLVAALERDGAMRPTFTDDSWAVLTR
jgi:hypothetical protein